MRLTGILDNDEIVLASQIENWVHIGRLAVDVNGNDGSHRRLQLTMNELAGPWILQRIRRFTKCLLASITVPVPAPCEASLNPETGFGRYWTFTRSSAPQLCSEKVSPDCQRRWHLREHPW